MKLTILRFAIILPLLAASIALSATAEDWERKVAQKGDVSIEFFVRGEGAVVLMHPGAGRSAQDYHALSERLAKADPGLPNSELLLPLAAPAPFTLTSATESKVRSSNRSTPDTG